MGPYFKAFKHCFIAIGLSPSLRFTLNSSMQAMHCKKEKHLRGCMVFVQYFMKKIINFQEYWYLCRSPEAFGVSRLGRRFWWAE